MGKCERESGGMIYFMSRSMEGYCGDLWAELYSCMAKDIDWRLTEPGMEIGYIMDKIFLVTYQ